MQDTWPLFGRDDELAVIQDAMDRPGISGVVVAGAAGVGKTRLAREVLAWAAKRGVVTRWAVATQTASAIPFGALAQLLPQLDEHALDRVVLLRWAAAALQQEAGTGRLVVGVDDAHLLDATSAALVHQLAATSTAFVVVTVRSGEPALDAIQALWKDRLAERLELQPLSHGEVNQLLRVVLGGHVDGRTLQRLWAATQGNSLLLHELVLAGLELGQLARHGGVWHWRGSLGVTPRLADLIKARLGRLDGPQRAALELLAAGEPLGPWIVDQLTAPGTIEALERRRLVAVEPRRRRLEARLTHPLYGEVVRHHTPAVRARTVRHQLADALERVGMRRREDLLRVATWWLDAATAAPPDLLTAAARRAGIADDVLAERLALAAVEAGGGFAAGMVLGQALFGQRRFGEAEQVLAGLAGLAVTGRQQVDLVIERADSLRLLGRDAEALAELQAAARSVADRGVQDQLAAALGKALIYLGRGHETLEMTAAVLAREPTDAVTFARAIWITAWALALAGRADEALAVIGRRERLGDRWRDQAPRTYELIDTIRAFAWRVLGRFDDAEAIAEAGYRQSVSDQWAWGVNFWTRELLYVALARGRVRTAVRWGQEGLAQVSTAGDATLPQLDLVVPLALAGDLDAAEAAFRAADVARVGGSQLGLLLVEQARRWIHAGRGRVSTAVSLALQAADLAESAGATTSYAVALHEAARLGDAAQAAPRLRALAGRVDGPLVALYAAHATALTRNEGAALDEVAVSFETIGAMLLAAETATHAAVAHRAAGREQAARGSAARAWALAGQCEGARTPALWLLEQPPELTPREREVAGLAAAGLSNRAIAQQLVVSVRTVDNHLQHVFDKLGIRNRRELGPLVGVGADAAHVPPVE